MDINNKIAEVIDIIKKDASINGCITGSCLLDADFNEWDTAPDVDIFTYSEGSFIDAINQMMYKHGFEPGVPGNPKSANGERWKINKTIKYGMRNNFALSTVKLNKDGVIVNISYRKDQESVCDVVTAFDMSIIMKGWDIRKGFLYDETGAEPMVAVPNRHRDQDTDLYTTQKWIRQFDRVIKYWNRGFDTRPMAQFYLDMIDQTLEIGSLFTSEKAIEAYETVTADFRNVREKISLWLEDKEDK